MNINDIEIKEDSLEKLDAIQGEPTKNYIFAPEFNAIVNKVKNNEFTFLAVANLPTNGILAKTIYLLPNGSWNLWTGSSWISTFKRQICQIDTTPKFAFGANGNENFFGIPQTQTTPFYTEDLGQSNHLLVTPNTNTNFTRVIHNCALEDIFCSTHFGSAMEIKIWKSSDPLGYNGTNAVHLYHTTGTLIVRRNLNLSVNADDFIHLSLKSQGSFRVYPDRFTFVFKN